MSERDSDTLVYSSEHSTIAKAARRGVPAIQAGREHGGARKNVDAARSRGGGTPPADGVVRVWLERHGRGGTPVSIVRGLALDAPALAALATRLKRLCGSGGTAKDGEIVIQGDHRARIAAELGKDGLRVKLAGA